APTDFDTPSLHDALPIYRTVADDVPAGRSRHPAEPHPARPVRPGRRTLHPGLDGAQERSRAAPGRSPEALQRRTGPPAGIHPARSESTRLNSSHVKISYA